MDPVTRIEQALTSAIASVETPDSPPLLAGAMRYAVFPGGARIRPQLTYAVARASSEDDPMLVDAAAAAIELLHCASLVHDDLPCFDDAGFRRGKPAVHRAFGEPVALLAGDALILLAFQTLARGSLDTPRLLAPLLQIVSRAVGMPSGIIAGQAWECEPSVDLSHYQRAKTGALFAAATQAGAAAVGAEAEPWRRLGELLGEAYQVADDIRDVAADPRELGKPTGQDIALGRPSAALQLGLDGALSRLDDLVVEAVHTIPLCPGRDALRLLILRQVGHFLPKELSLRAA